MGSAVGEWIGRTFTVTLDSWSEEGELPSGRGDISGVGTRMLSMYFLRYEASGDGALESHEITQTYDSGVVLSSTTEVDLREGTWTVEGPRSFRFDYIGQDGVARSMGCDLDREEDLFCTLSLEGVTSEFTFESGVIDEWEAPMD
ncbi:MAG: hypothetical protein EA397_02495 [Deltaproteobacteria bacterium]|nr:MAG: hypothetical protein EA397_02495 [Deltaproteobacteria bacterium]